MRSVHRVRARVERNRPVARDTWWLEVSCPEIAPQARPGQFVMLGYGLADVAAPFLPRPFSIGAGAATGTLGFLVRAFGAGTRRLAEATPGDELLVVGPLGHPFDPSPERSILCFAGGVGLAPFLFLAARMRRASRSVGIVYGERTADRVFDTDLMRELTGVEPEIWTEDGTRGRAGRVIDDPNLAGRPHLLACGPEPMLLACARIAAEAELPLQVSVEEHMACGVGTCQGCVVRSTRGEWIRSCTEGPVFDAQELAWPS